mmetsp:Transcript_19386/g.65374  ORF Transcript_19386/g.65374 Transcript_19386/m.65374 type:complete len:359 (+) Transcript_19386:414-1490(+)
MPRRRPRSEQRLRSVRIPVHDRDKQCSVAGSVLLLDVGAGGQQRLARKGAARRRGTQQRACRMRSSAAAVARCGALSAISLGCLAVSPGNLPRLHASLFHSASVVRSASCSEPARRGRTSRLASSQVARSESSRRTQSSSTCSTSTCPPVAAAWIAVPSPPTDRAGCAPWRRRLRTVDRCPWLAAPRSAWKASASRSSPGLPSASRSSSQQAVMPAAAKAASGVSPRRLARCASGAAPAPLARCHAPLSRASRQESASAALGACSASQRASACRQPSAATSTASREAPARMSACAASVCTCSHAARRGVTPPQSAASASAPAASNASSESSRPAAAAACSAVRPASSLSDGGVFSSAA